MNIKIKSLTGKIINLHVESSETINQVKQRIQEMEGINPDQQRLIFNGVLLANEVKVTETKIEPGSVLHMVLALRGGGKKSLGSDIYTDLNSVNEIIVSPVILPDDKSNLIETDDNDDSLYEISFRNTSTGSNYSNDSTYKSIDKSKKLCCLIL